MFDQIKEKVAEVIVRHAIDQAMATIFVGEDLTPETETFVRAILDAQDKAP